MRLFRLRERREEKKEEEVVEESAASIKRMSILLTMDRHFMCQSMHSGGRLRYIIDLQKQSSSLDRLFHPP